MEQKKTVHPVVQGAVLLHLLLVVSWTLPRVPDDIQSGEVTLTPQTSVTRAGDWLLVGNDRFRWETPGVKQYMLSTGFWQYWDMFAPNPANVDFWLDTVVTYEDGTERVVPYPRMKTMSIPEKFFNERFRKFTERVNPDEFAWKWPTFAQRMALIAYTDPANPPKIVVLRRHFMVFPHMSQPKPTEYTTYAFFSHVVDQERLRKDKGL